MCVCVHVWACECLYSCMCVFCPCPSAFGSPDYDTYDMSTDDMCPKASLFLWTPAALWRGCSSLFPTPPKYKLFLWSLSTKPIYLLTNVFQRCPRSVSMLLFEDMLPLFWPWSVIGGGDIGVKFVWFRMSSTAAPPCPWPYRGIMASPGAPGGVL